MQMRGGLYIGRLFGIRLMVDWSWSFVFLLMSWNLTEMLRAAHPAWGVGTAGLLATTSALLFFASVLLHEMAHALVAKSYGMTVTEIRLFLFGGVANIDREPPSATAELWIAIVGPLTSLGIGVALTLVAALFMPAPPLDRAPTSLETLARLGPMVTLLGWLGTINLAVGVFNMIPGFPLDGGRVLRAVIWRATGNLHKATIVASTGGRLVGWSFIALGIAMVFGAKVPWFGEGAGSGVWLALIGWFLSSAAQRSFGALVIQEALNGVSVSQLMRKTGPTVSEDLSVRSLVEDWFMQTNEHAFPILEHDRLVGLVCAEDVGRVPASQWGQTSVARVMTPRSALTVVQASTDAESALRALGEREVEQLPVVDEGDKLVGMLSRGDLARWLELHLGEGRPTGGGGGRWQGAYSKS